MVELNGYGGYLSGWLMQAYQQDTASRSIKVAGVYGFLRQIQTTSLAIQRVRPERNFCVKWLISSLGARIRPLN
jgi:hypothetical protein